MDSERCGADGCESRCPGLGSADGKYCETAWSRFFKTEGQRVFGYLLKKTRNRHLAEDVLQEALRKFFEKIDDYHDPTRHPLPLLLTIARNTANNFFRDAQKFSDELPEDMPNGEGRISEKEILDEVALETAAGWVMVETGLDESQSTLFAYLVIEDLSVGEIAEVMGLPPGVVSKRLWRLRKKIKKKINRNDIDDLM